MSKAEEVKNQRVLSLMEDTDLTFVTFKGAPYYRITGENRTPGFVALKDDDFARIAYGRYPGISKNGISDLQHAVELTSPDITAEAGHLISFYDGSVWDMDAVEFRDDYAPTVIYSSTVSPKKDTDAAQKFLLQLAKGDSALARDYLQAIAPLFMKERPLGVIWFVGNGANGKSSLLKALDMILGRYFTSLTVADLEDGKRTPELNGKLGNIVMESSEQRVEDAGIYKSIGAHETFQTRKYYSQESIDVSGDLHHIFNANNIPTFGDKTKGVRRRTLVIPFPAHFEDDPLFEKRTFTPAFLGGLLTLILDEARAMKARGYKYDWSPTTLEAKAQYDSEINSAEAYLDTLMQDKVRGFYNWKVLQGSYEWWCDQNAYPKVFPVTLKKTFNAEVMPERLSARDNENRTTRYWYFKDVDPKQVIFLDNGYAYDKPDDGKVAQQMTLDAQEAQDEW